MASDGTYYANSTTLEMCFQTCLSHNSISALNVCVSFDFIYEDEKCFLNWVNYEPTRTYYKGVGHYTYNCIIKGNYSYDTHYIVHIICIR